MTQSEKSGDSISLGLAFQSVMLSQGAASSLLQWMAQQIGHETEAGAALRDAGITIGSEDITPARASSRTSKDKDDDDDDTAKTPVRPSSTSSASPSSTGTSPSRATSSSKDD